MSGASVEMTVSGASVEMTVSGASVEMTVSGASVETTVSGAKNILCSVQKKLTVYKRGHRYSTHSSGQGINIF